VNSTVAKLILMFSLLLVSMHTSPLAHAALFGHTPLAKGHDCSDHVHQTVDRHDAPQPKALLQNAYAIYYSEDKRISDENVAWGDAPPLFVPFSDDVINSRNMRPPIPPPTA
jgi:hypothetical protein